MLDPIDIKFFKLAIGSGRVKSETSQDIAARCPICGDSKYSKNKARLHLYQKNDVTLVNCFNECSCQNISVYNFLKNYSIIISSEESLSLSTIISLFSVTTGSVVGFSVVGCLVVCSSVVGGVYSP